MRVESSTAGWNVHRQNALARNPAAAGAGVARLLNDLAAALAGGAGSLDGEKALAGPHLAEALAGRASDGAGARFRAGAAAGFAGHRGGDADLRGLAGERVAKRNFHVVFEIGAALLGAASAAAAASHELAEQVVEYLRHRGREVVAEPVARAIGSHRSIESGVAELIVSRAFLRVLQRLVSLVDLFEIDFGCGVSRILIGMKLFREPPESAFDFVIGCALFQAEHFIVIALHGLFLRSFAMRACQPEVQLRLLKHK